jgi:hypothetical protein
MPIDFDSLPAEKQLFKRIDHGLKSLRIGDADRQYGVEEGCFPALRLSILPATTVEFDSCCRQCLPEYYAIS